MSPLNHLFRRHSDYLDFWRYAMENGLIDGRPYSDSTKRHYLWYMTGFLKRYENTLYAFDSTTIDLCL